MIWYVNVTEDVPGLFGISNPDENMACKDTLSEYFGTTQDLKIMTRIETTTGSSMVVLIG